MTNFIENQNWRYATKKFDASKKIKKEDLEFLLQAIQLSTSSYGLQPYKIFIIENPEIRQQLLPFSWNQQQIVDASHVLVFASQTKINETDIDTFIDNTVNTRQIPKEKLQGYSDFMKSKLLKLSDEEISIWTAKQSYLALANLINAAAELKIDVTPMEGFSAPEYNKILNLDNLNLTAALVAPIGYRHQDDATQHLKKVRKPIKDLFITL
jgi:nitroreductase